MRFRISNLTRQTVLAGRAEVADREATRRKGLLGRDGLAPGEGLWILPCEAVHTFGMRFPIDLVYIDRKQRVRKVRSAVRPWRMSACLFAHSVIELAAGTILATKTGPEIRSNSLPPTPPNDTTFSLLLRNPEHHKVESRVEESIMRRKEIRVKVTTLGSMRCSVVRCLRALRLLDCWFGVKVKWLASGICQRYVTAFLKKGLMKIV